MALSIEAQQLELKKRLSSPKEAPIFNLFVLTARLVIIAGLSSAGQRLCGPEGSKSVGSLPSYQKGSAMRRKYAREIETATGR
jgi:hypothetical protein